MLIFNGWIPKIRDQIFGRLFVFLQYLFVGLTNLAVSVWVLGVWGENLSVPWISRGDGELNLILVRNIQRTGWLFDNTNLGAPGKSQIYDLPQGGENLQFLVMKVLAYFTSAAGAVNIYYLLTFPIIAMAAFGAAKWWGLKPSTAFVLSTLYAFLPYHFFRGEGHLLLSMYAFIPIVVVYCFKSVNSKVELKKWQWILFAVLAASINSYYTVFGLVLIVLALLSNMARKHNVNTRQQIKLVGSIIVIFIFNQLPSIIYMIQHGKNNVVGERGYDGAEVYGLQITDMFLPRIGHRIGAFSEAGIAASKAGLRSEYGQSLGLIASVGVISLILYGIYKNVRQDKIDERFHFPFMLTMALILLTVSSSITLLAGMAGFTEIRSWNRVVVIIGFVGLLLVGSVLEKVTHEKNLSNYFTSMILILVLVVGLLDQTSVEDRVDIRTSAREFKSECTMLSTLVNKTSNDALVFQLPFVQFPEVGAVGGLGPYHQGMATLCDTELKFSYGATRGRNDDFQSKLGKNFNCDTVESCSNLEYKIDDSLKQLRDAKFSAVMIYRKGYADQGRSIEHLLVKKMGEPIETTDDSALAFPL